MMKTSTAIILVFFLSLFLSSCDDKKCGCDEKSLFEPIKTSEGQIKESEYKMNFDLLRNVEKSGEKIPAMFLGKDVTLVRKEIITRSETNMTWRGKVEGEEFSDATFSIVDGFLRGQININTDTYSVSPAKNGNYLVIKADKTKAITGHDDVVVPPIK